MEMNNQYQLIETNVKAFMCDYFNTEIININKEKCNNKNLSKAFRGIGDFGEELATILFPNSFGSASKGGCAFDNFELIENKISLAREVKTCCRIQPKECLQCNNKAPYFQEKCIFCNGNNFKIIKDSRYSIDVDAHFKYIELLKEYLLVVIDIDDNNTIITFEIYKINPNNHYFTNYLKNQKENSKSSNCNMLPYSYDGYASGIIKIIEMKFDLTGSVLYEKFDISNTAEMDFPLKYLSKKEIIDYELSEETNDVVSYNIIKDKLKLRKKNLNKPRGTTSRL
jgi:hypothetical protein